MRTKLAATLGLFVGLTALGSIPAQAACDACSLAGTGVYGSGDQLTVAIHPRAGQTAAVLFVPAGGSAVKITLVCLEMSWRPPSGAPSTIATNNFFWATGRGADGTAYYITVASYVTLYPVPVVRQRVKVSTTPSASVEHCEADLAGASLVTAGGYVFAP